MAEGHIGKALGPAQLYRFASAVVEDRGDDPGLTGQQAGIGHRDRATVQHRQTPGLLALQGGQVAGEVQGCGVAVPLGCTGVGAIGGDHLVQGFGVPAGSAGEDPIGVGLVLPGRRDCGPQGIAEELAGVGGQAAVQVPHAIGALVDFQPCQGLLAHRIEQGLLVEQLRADPVEVLGEFTGGGVNAVLPDQLLGSTAENRRVIRGLDQAIGVGNPGVDRQAFALEAAHGVGDGIDAGSPREGGGSEVLELRGEPGNGGHLAGAGRVEVEGFQDPVTDAGEAVASLVQARGGIGDDRLEGIGILRARLRCKGFDLGAEECGLGVSVRFTDGFHPAHPLGSYPVVVLIVVVSALSQ